MVTSLNNSNQDVSIAESVTLSLVSDLGTILTSFALFPLVTVSLRQTLHLEKTKQCVMTVPSRDQLLNHYNNALVKNQGEQREGSV